jgi:transcription initiation factor TFIID subunit 5
MMYHRSTVLCVAFSPDGRFLASGSGDLRVLVWDIAYGHLLAELSHHTSNIAGLAFSREGTVLASSAIGRNSHSC